jgi:hypothetical protein
MKLTGKMLTVLLAAVVFSAVSVAVGVAQAPGVVLTPGDIFVVDQGVPGIIRVDPTTGNQAVVSSASFLAGPRGIALDANGDILVASGFDFTGGVVRVDPATGNQTVVSSGGFFVQPADLALDANGDILVADFSAGVIRVNAVTGAQTVVSSGGNFTTISGIAIAANGDIIISDFDNFLEGPGEVIRVNPLTGAQHVVSTGGNFFNPAGIAIAANGDILVANQGFYPGGVNSIIRVNPVTGAQTVVFSSSSILPAAIELDAAGDILAADYFGSVIKLDPKTGGHTIVSSGGSFVQPIGIAIVPPAREPGCPREVSAQVDIVDSRFHSIPFTLFRFQWVIVRNKTSIPISGPLAFAMDELQNAVFIGSSLKTRCFSPDGDPFMLVPAGSDNVLSPNESVLAGLWFFKTHVGRITYTPHVLSGTPTQ